MLKYLFLLLFLGAGFLTRGQQNASFQVWSDATLNYRFHDKWSTGGDIGYRFNTANDFQQFYLRPGVRFRANKYVGLSVGTAFFYTWDRNITDSYELRTFEYAYVYWPRIGGFRFSHRIGLDQRWFYLPVFAVDGFRHRFRYRLRLRSPDFDFAGKTPPFYVVADFELLRNINDNTITVLFDNDRFMFGLGNRVTPKLRAEIQFMIINHNEILQHKFIRERNVLRLKIFYQFARG